MEALADQFWILAILVAAVSLAEAFWIRTTFVGTYLLPLLLAGFLVGKRSHNSLLGLRFGGPRLIVLDPSDYDIPVPDQRGDFAGQFPRDRRVGGRAADDHAAVAQVEGQSRET